MAVRTWLFGVLLLLALQDVASTYLLGAGKSDITGPAADVNMMGYAKQSQTAAGIHIRQYARSFIFAENGDNNGTRVLFINIDACMTGQLVTVNVLNKLSALYGDLYTADNVVISGIHTHSGPAGFLQYVLYDFTSLGFVKETMDSLVDGIVESVTAAHKSVKPGNVLFNEGELLEANRNRSPTAYLRNPAEERAKYKHDTDKNVSQITFQDTANTPFAAINWFPVHCTSMNNTNQLISSDNKGAAARLLESDMSPEDKRTLRGAEPSFIGAFAQANVGDTSPNILGAFCTDTGLPCDNPTSTCNNRTELCNARGPGWPDIFKSTHTIASRQFAKAKELIENSKVVLEGSIDYRHMNIDMSKVNVSLADGSFATTCPPAMGYSFAAGTTDGPGDFDFTQGSTSGNPFWNFLSHLIKNPTPDQVKCQHPKPILLDCGQITEPYAWQPSIVPVSILRVGQLLILAVPGEFTTMSGRRLRDAVRKVVGDAFGPDLKITIAGLSGAYSSYIATYEEYQEQRYEGASTIYGPHTLQAYIQNFEQMAAAMVKGQPIPAGPPTPDLSSKQLSFLTPVVDDGCPFGKDYGDVLVDVLKTPYKPGSVVTVEFQSASPRNDRRPNGTFLTVERLSANSTVSHMRSRKALGPLLLEADAGWEIVHTDSEWCTKYKWARPWKLSTESTATIEWTIPADALSGTYRIRHFGARKHLLGGIKQFSGTSSTFTVEGTSTDRPHHARISIS